MGTHRADLKTGEVLRGTTRRTRSPIEVMTKDSIARKAAAMLVAWRQDDEKALEGLIALGRPSTWIIPSGAGCFQIGDWSAEGRRSDRTLSSGAAWSGRRGVVRGRRAPDRAACIARGTRRDRQLAARGLSGSTVSFSRSQYAFLKSPFSIRAVEGRAL
jgi:hypothetical protein